MELARQYEANNGRTAMPVHKNGVGYDLFSTSNNEERHIEVKGVSESWKTYNWQSLHHTEVKSLREDPEHFYLYIIHFDIINEDRDEAHLSNAPRSLFIIKGQDLLSIFNLTPASYSLRPISQRKLEPYKMIADNLV